MSQILSIDDLDTISTYQVDSGLGGIFKLRYQGFNKNHKRYIFNNISLGWEQHQYYFKKSKVLKEVTLFE